MTIVWSIHEYQWHSATEACCWDGFGRTGMILCSHRRAEVLPFSLQQERRYSIKIASVSRNLRFTMLKIASDMAWNTPGIFPRRRRINKISEPRPLPLWAQIGQILLHCVMLNSNRIFGLKAKIGYNSQSNCPPLRLHCHSSRCKSSLHLQIYDNTIDPCSLHFMELFLSVLHWL